MKYTIFNAIHKELNAKMVAFAGYEMPIQYPNGIIHEHNVIRHKVGVFDVSHMGEFEIRGKDALAYVQKITVNDASKLTPGKVQYSAFCLPHGGIVDDLLVYCMGDWFMLVVNGANIDKDFAWCQKNTEGFEVELNNVTDEVNLLAVQGPKSLETLQKLTGVNLTEIEYYNFRHGAPAGVEMIISRTGYTGELGFELYFRGDFNTAKHVWDEIFKAGAEFGIEPVGLGSRDTLRLEKGYCLYGNDIDETTNTIEAGLGWITKPAKGDFNGKEVIVKVKEEGPKRRLVGFIVEAEKFIPRHEYKIIGNGIEIGHVTSGNISPVLNKPIGMGYVSNEYSTPGSKIEIGARGKTFPAEVVKMPFV
ncbi:MAG: glycine cleavage system protein T [Ignavibacteria bacterium GWB2_35_12]|nr:MAG: glycine cleavage system protein T [Ignavibacteria bacterium GWA2_35_8]OGU40505.1 MAG: glycine cleavage system protein T [Ignavibacteria bacterium GWB2_35_12]OGU94077.1 MAG: glycine cleavage system protein T [Ignavibacteria bacterium RIFOXYA2_FULL_35_10]OGV23548.1 MAG: glycine cleavage system protein T [Ignavibacteria bacterium RIFOXYC2_FULL_35_21]